MIKKYFLILFAGLLFFKPNLLYSSTLKNETFKTAIWAWERTENLLFLEGSDVEINFYAGITLYKNGITSFTPRRNPLIVPDDVYLIAVFRIENRQSFIPTSNQLEETVKNILNVCNNKRISGCQIDFDAKVSEQVFYKQLLTSLKKNLPYYKILTMTALASWSYEGSWLDSLPVKYATPMFFRMGVDDFSIRNMLVGESFMGSKVTKEFVGISTDEPLPPAKYLRNRKFCIFNSKPWTEENFKEIISKVENHINGDK
ncbi:hypothetical protein M0P98_02020 [bacterium]|nr:hypothetical protein [bacterium]